MVEAQAPDFMKSFYKLLKQSKQAVYEKFYKLLKQSKQAFYEKFLETFKANGRSPGSRVYEKFL